MKNRTLLFTITVLILTGCASNHRIEHYHIPVMRSDVQKLSKERAYIRTTVCDIYFEYMSITNWRHLVQSETYQVRGSHPVVRFPKLLTYQLLITNTQKDPIVIKDISLKYGTITAKALDQKQLKTVLKSPAYKMINTNEMVNFRRLLVMKNKISKINYDEETISYNFKFIGPKDTVITFALFKEPPVQFKKHTIIITLLSGNTKKTIDFDIEEFEYRSNGEHYADPDKDLEEENYEN